MKKIALLFSAALLMLAASCTNQEIVSDEAQPLKLNITVAAPGGPDTKAAKKNWTDGDKLNCWFDVNNVNHKDPDLVITKTSDGWEADGLRSGVTLNATGYFSVVYESSNNLDGYTPKTYEGDQHYYFYAPEAKNSETSTSEDTPCYCTPLICVAQGIEYTFDGSSLTAEISGWSVHTTFKVLIKNVPPEYEAKDLMLKTTSFTYTTFTAVPTCGFSLMKGSFYPEVNGRVNGFSYAGGVQETDGIAFYYHYFWPYDYNESQPEHNSITLTLCVDGEVKNCTVADKFFVNPGYNYCYGVSINYDIYFI